MTFSSFFFYLIARKLSIKNRDVLEYSFAGEGALYLRRLLWAIILGTFAIESIGAAVLSIRFSQSYAISRAIYLGLFHAVSAFCNAGFSLIQTNLIGYQSDILINLVIAFLIILGGIGFWVLYDLKNVFQHTKHVHSTTLHTRVVITMSLLLLAFAFIMLLGFEWGNSFGSLTVKSKILAAFFHSVSSRTAGFNTVNIASLSNASIFLLLLLMFIGASPGSCGGGIKTTTFAIIPAMIVARIRNQQQVQLFNRGIPAATVSRAIAIVFAAITLLVLMCLMLLVTEASAGLVFRDNFVKILFEAVSAFGTVGLSMGLTPMLSPLGKIIITILMFIGRLGPVTLTLALAGGDGKNIRLAEDNVWVG